jgi:bifunctional non-homologous end joining protein LigD
VIDGKAVLLGVDGRSDFNGLRSRRHNGEVEFYAFDMLVSDGEDIRELPLSMRKTNLARILARLVDGTHLAPFEQGEIGPDLFRHACLMGLEGLVSKHRDRPYRPGRSQHWVKVSLGISSAKSCRAHLERSQSSCVGLTARAARGVPVYGLDKFLGLGSCLTSTGERHA